MAQIKLTKSELRSQQLKLTQLTRYLPTLQLKKAMLQTEVMLAQQEIEDLEDKYREEKKEVENFQSLLSMEALKELTDALYIVEVKKDYESIAGVEIPFYREVVFQEALYWSFDTPLWLDDAILALRSLLRAKEKVFIAKEKKRLLEAELREVSIRVNLFEKVMIPRTLENIKKIKVFLGDQQLAAVCQAKVAKRKIVERVAS
ncbi:MAG: V-type ATP synthase subunit D [Chlamydiae bacterium]|nr:V-type ATP synthase subunit D [Chlamydiota bacterium]